MSEVQKHETSVFLRVEGVNLGQFVFDTKDLSTIRGGSFLLLDAVRHWIPEQFDDVLQPVSTGASIGLYRISDDCDPEVLRQEIERWLRGHDSLKHATFVVDVISQNGDFSHAMESLIAKNRWRQMRSPSLAYPTNERGVREACSKDLVRPADAEKKVLGESVSRSVWERQRHGIEKKQEFYESETGLSLEREFARDLGEIAGHDDSGRYGKVAVLHIDGNNFGKARQRSASVESLRRFDEEIQSARREFLSALVNEIKNEETGWVSDRDRYRLEILLWGGDEIRVVMPAQMTWEVLDVFFKACRPALPKEDCADYRELPELTHSAGLVFCSHKAPIHRVVHLSEELCRMAKVATDRAENAMAYQVLESFDHTGVDLQDYRERFSGKACRPESLVLRAVDLAGIEEAIRAIARNAPHGPVMEAVEAYRDEGPDSPAAKSLRTRIISDRYRVVDDVEYLESVAPEAPAAWLHLVELWEYMGE